MLYLNFDVGVRKDEKGTWNDRLIFKILIIAMAAPATVDVEFFPHYGPLDLSGKVWKRF